MDLIADRRLVDKGEPRVAEPVEKIEREHLISERLRPLDR